MSSLAQVSGYDGPLVEVRGLSKVYHTEGGDIEVLSHVNLILRAGEMVAVMGPSGSGKSSFLFVLGLFQPPSGGEYRVLGQDVLNLDREGQAEFRRTRIGFVFQNCDLLDHSTVYENLEFPMIYRGVDRRMRPEIVKEALERVNLGHRIYHQANFLSGGERQRVAVARALVNDAPFILADEPTGQLDSRNSRMVMDHFVHIVEESQKAVLVVTHDPEVAERCQKTYILRDGELNEGKPLRS